MSEIWIQPHLHWYWILFKNPRKDKEPLCFTSPFPLTHCKLLIGIEHAGRKEKRLKFSLNLNLTINSMSYEINWQTGPCKKSQGNEVIVIKTQVHFRWVKKESELLSSAPLLDLIDNYSFYRFT